MVTGANYMGVIHVGDPSTSFIRPPSLSVRLVVLPKDANKLCRYIALVVTLIDHLLAQIDIKSLKTLSREMGDFIEIGLSGPVLIFNVKV